MARFKIWLEQLQPQNAQELQKIWADTFKALGVGGLADEDAAQQSLSKITFGSRGPEGSASTFKGKQAVRKRLENGQIFQRLQKVSDPEIQKQIEDTRRWLDTQGSGHEANASTTVSNLLQKLFGKYFQQFIDKDFPKPDTAKAQVQPQPPRDSGDMAAPDPTPQGPENLPPQAGAAPMDQQMAQPQMPSGMQPPQPSNPMMPPAPPGVNLGLY